MGNPDITARVTLLGEFTGEKFVKFGAENTVCDKLALFADLSGHREEAASLRTRKISSKTSSGSKGRHPSQRGMHPGIEHSQTSRIRQAQQGEDTNLAKCVSLTPGVVLCSTPVDICCRSNFELRSNRLPFPIAPPSCNFRGDKQL